MTWTLNCPHCGSTTTGQWFCQACGEPLRPAAPGSPPPGVPPTARPPAAIPPGTVPPFSAASSFSVGPFSEPVSQQPASSTRRIQLAVAVGAVLVILTGVTLALNRNTQDTGAIALPTAAPTPATSLAPTPAPATSTVPALSSGPATASGPALATGTDQPPGLTPSVTFPSDSLTAPTGSADGLVTLDAAGTAPAAPDVAKAAADTLDTYFANVNLRDLQAAYAVYSARQQAATPFPEWSAGMTGSTISEVVVRALSGATTTLGRPVTAEVTFVSRQPADRGPVRGQTCTRWTLVYSLVPDHTGFGYLIDGAKASSGKGYTAC